jgi:predicted ATPase
LVFSLFIIHYSLFIQPLLLLKQSYLQQKYLLSQGLLLDNRDLQLGRGEDVYPMYGTDDKLIRFEVEWDEGLKLVAEFQHQENVDLLPLACPLTLSNQEKIFQQSLFANKCQYISAERTGSRDFFPVSYYHLEELRSLGTGGHLAVHFIAEYQREEIPIKGLAHPKTKSLKLLDHKNAWLCEITPGVKIESEVYDRDTANLSYRFQHGGKTTEKMSPINVSFGLTHVLPVVTAILSAQPGDLLIIEHPESHIHPQQQAMLSKLFVLAATHGLQLFIETLSDQIVEGVQAAVQNQQISPNQVGVFLFERDFEAEAPVIRITQPYLNVKNL